MSMLMYAFSGFLISLLSAISLIRDYSVLSLFSGVAFWYSVCNLDKREDELNKMPAGSP